MMDSSKRCAMSLRSCVSAYRVCVAQTQSHDAPSNVGGIWYDSDGEVVTQGPWLSGCSDYSPSEPCHEARGIP